MKWTVEELYERILKQDEKNGINLCMAEAEDEDVYWRIPPWRSLDLHSSRDAFLQAERAQRKRKQGDDSSNEPNPPLNIPTDDFSPKFMIYRKRGYPKLLVPGVKWVEQCYGCGKPVSCGKHCYIKVTEWAREEPALAVPNGDFGEAMYCSIPCAMDKGAKVWSQVGKKYTKFVDGSGNFLDSDGTFWQELERHPNAVQLMKAGGWTQENEYTWRVYSDG